MTATAVTNESFWDRAAPGYAKRPVKDEEAYARTLERVAHYLSPESRVLEFGCGTGTTALALAAHAREIVATDISSKMVSIAQEKATAQGAANVTFCQAVLEEPPPHQIPFDVVMAFNFFHLLPDLSSALTRIFEMLPSGGLFISKTPCIGECGVGMRLVIRVMQLVGQAPFVNFVKKEELLRTLQDVGFSLVEEGLYPKKSHSLFIVARKP